jgi:hypothetical protein
MVPPTFGGRSSVGRAPDCGSGCRGFKPRRSPQKVTSKRKQTRPPTRVGGLASLCAQHGRCLAGASPAERRSSRSKRTATARGRPSVGRKRGAKPQADGQKPGTRRRRGGRAGKAPRSSTQLPRRLEGLRPARRYAAHLQRPRRMDPSPPTRSPPQTVEARQDGLPRARRPGAPPGDSRGDRQKHPSLVVELEQGDQRRFPGLLFRRPRLAEARNGQELWIRG